MVHTQRINKQIKRQEEEEEKRRKRRKRKRRRKRMKRRRRRNNNLLGLVRWLWLKALGKFPVGLTPRLPMLTLA